MSFLINDKANYISDVYIEHEKLNKILKYSFKLELSEALRLIKFLEYIPESWNVDNALDTKVKDLNVNDLRHLEVVKRDYIIAHNIKEKLRGKDYDKDIYDYATKIDINKVIGYKFNLEEIKKKYKSPLNSSIDNKKFFIEILNGKFDRSIEQEVLLYLLTESIPNKTKIK